MPRRPKPTAQKVLEGNPGKRPLPRNEPKLLAAIPEMPTQVASNVVARIEWHDITSLLFEHGMITGVDGKSLAIYCIAFADYIEAISMLEEHGKTQTSTRTRTESRSPWLGIKDRAEDVMRRYLIEFGLTPASRTKVTAATKQATQTTGYGALVLNKKKAGA
jgi:P27 family predicted phage terminase small subunit